VDCAHGLLDICLCLSGARSRGLALLLALRLHGAAAPSDGARTGVLAFALCSLNRGSLCRCSFCRSGLALGAGTSSDARHLQRRGSPSVCLHTQESPQDVQGAYAGRKKKCVRLLHCCCSRTRALQTFARVLLLTGVVFAVAPLIAFDAWVKAVGAEMPVPTAAFDGPCADTVTAVRREMRGVGVVRVCRLSEREWEIEETDRDRDRDREIQTERQRDRETETQHTNLGQTDDDRYSVMTYA
jgi:hypothetical protein